MALNRPHFFIKHDPKEGEKEYLVYYNCNGGLDFLSTTRVDQETYRLLQFAIEEGKRLRSFEIRNLLGVDNGRF